jgi:hypothetical protein
MKRLFGLVLIACMLGVPACTTAKTADDEEASSFWGFKRTAPTITVPAGTRFQISLQQGVGSDTSDPGSVFSAVLAAPIAVDGKTVFEKGSAVTGRVTDVKKSGRVKGRASISLVLTSIVHDSKTVPITTQTYTGVAKPTKKRDVGIIGGAAGVGAAIGAITGGGKGAATGAAIGGAGGAGAVLLTRGKDIHYPPETRLSFALSNPVAVKGRIEESD